jgi:PAS domain S-box-containing protein
MKQETSDHDRGRRTLGNQSRPHSVCAEAVLDGMSAGLFGYEKSKTGFSIVWASGAFAEVTGYAETEVVGKKLDFFYGSRTDPLVVRSINRALSLGRTFRGDFLFCRKDGTAIWSSLVLVPTPTADRPSSFFSGGLMDISPQKIQEDQLKAREATFRGIFENAVEGIYQSTPDGNYLEVNPSLARMYGYKNPKQLLSQLRDIQHEIYVDPSMRERFKDEIEKADVVHGLEY